MPISRRGFLASCLGAGAFALAERLQLDGAAQRRTLIV